MCRDLLIEPPNTKVMWFTDTISSRTSRYLIQVLLSSHGSPRFCSAFISLSYIVFFSRVWWWWACSQVFPMNILVKKKKTVSEYSLQETVSYLPSCPDVDRRKMCYCSEPWMLPRFLPLALGSFSLPFVKLGFLTWGSDLNLLCENCICIKHCDTTKRNSN